MSNFQLKTGGAQKGFTLIEMSIVLVIIGLIIGGILKGQEIIDASRQKNFVSQIDALRAAGNAFQDRFNATPGDYQLAVTRISAEAINGTGDGFLGTNLTTITLMNAETAGASASTAGGTAAAAGEYMNYWCQLTAAGLIGGGSMDCDATVTFFGNGAPYPAASFANSGLTVVQGNHNLVNAKQAIWARLHRSPTVALTSTATGLLSSRIMSQIDTKYDDGLPIGGLMRTSNFGTGCPAATSGDVYNRLSDLPECNMYIEVGK